MAHTEKPLDISQEDWDMNRWSDDYWKLGLAAAESCLSILGISRGEYEDLFINSLIGHMNSISGGNELGSIGPSHVTEDDIPDGYELVAHPEFVVYVKQDRQPEKQHGHITNYPGFFSVLVKSNDETWKRQFMHFDYWIHTAELYRERITMHKSMIELARARE